MVNEDKILQDLAGFKKHDDINLALYYVSKAKQKTGKDRFMLLYKAKNILYPFSSDKAILQAINDIDAIA